ncbi:hypothetical protein F3Y22_tig00112256pilonHSYRG00003 [Hibiscus syriacus]|uniref:RNase H type-1 domain-containing protein n=1 Tax=Hibiscus syriacus TaxID=106335 RepID=A0A6A2XH42_HIBSY|nr:hypothetical protein F3Y22_tig00112256pilonHSYRG00003 [Hibiscus syriacus]
MGTPLRQPLISTHSTPLDRELNNEPTPYAVAPTNKLCHPLSDDTIFPTNTKARAWVRCGVGVGCCGAGHEHQLGWWFVQDGYLGLPLGQRSNSKLMWQPIPARLEGWQGKLLSFGGRLTLVRSVLSNLPPKEYGGLGFFDINLRNRSLLNKWSWRYGQEPNSLWRKVVDAKTNSASKGLLPSPLKCRKASWVWRNIAKPLSYPNDVFTGNLRIFALAIKKEGKVSDFGRKVNGNWEWSVVLRRQLFDWEEIPRILMSLKLFVSKYLLLERLRIDSGSLFGLVWLLQKWKHLCGKPPKIVFQSDLNYKSGVSLSKIRGDALCVGKAKKQWTICFGIVKYLGEYGRSGVSFGMSMFSSGKLEDLLILWVHVPVKSSLKPLWQLAFFGIVWTLWLVRNEVIFNNKKCETMNISDLVLMRIGLWAKSKWPNAILSINDFISYPLASSIKLKISNRPAAGSWVAPPQGKLKFNVDAAVQSYVGLTGIGGLFRDHNGMTLIRFSRVVDQVDSFGAELAAILEACQIFSSSRWAKNSVLIVDSDCLRMVSWIENPSTAPPPFVEMVANCNEFCVMRSWRVSFAHRERNLEAHELAQEGIRRSQPFLWVKANDGKESFSSFWCEVVVAPVILVFAAMGFSRPFAVKLSLCCLESNILRCEDEIDSERNLVDNQPSLHYEVELVRPFVVKLNLCCLEWHDILRRGVEIANETEKLFVDNQPSLRYEVELVRPFAVKLNLCCLESNILRCEVEFGSEIACRQSVAPSLRLFVVKLRLAPQLFVDSQPPLRCEVELVLSWVQYPSLREISISGCFSGILVLESSSSDLWSQILQMFKYDMHILFFDLRNAIPKKLSQERQNLVPKEIVSRGDEISSKENIFKDDASRENCLKGDKILFQEKLSQERRNSFQGKCFQCLCFKRNYLKRDEIHFKGNVFNVYVSRETVSRETKFCFKGNYLKRDKIHFKGNVSNVYVSRETVSMETEFCFKGNYLKRDKTHFKGNVFNVYVSRETVSREKKFCFKGNCLKRDKVCFKGNCLKRDNGEHDSLRREVEIVGGPFVVKLSQELDILRREVEIQLENANWIGSELSLELV